MTLSGSISKGQCCVYAQREGVGPAGFGIDKLKLRSEDFQIDDWRGWNDRPAPTRKAGELEAPPPSFLTTIAGKDIYNGLYFNDPQGKYTADVLRDMTGKLALYVTVNPSKLHGHLTTEPNILHDVMQDVRAAMRDTLRVDFDLMTATPSRADFAADAVLSYPVNTYAEIIRGSKARPNAPQAEYPNGFLFGSGTSWQSCVYDKGKKNALDDLKRSGLKSYAMPPASNLMRNEARFHNAAAIRRHGNGCAETFSGLLEAQPKELHAMYLKATEHFLRLHQIRTVWPAVEFSQLHGVLLQCLTAAPRTALNDFLAILTNEEKDLHTIDWRALISEAYHAAARTAGKPAPNRSTIKRAIDKFERLRYQNSALRALRQREAQDMHTSKLAELRAVFIEPYKTAI